MLIGFQIKNVICLVLELLSDIGVKLKILELFFLRPNELLYLVSVLPVLAPNFAHLLQTECFSKHLALSLLVARFVLLRTPADS